MTAPANAVLSLHQATLTRLSTDYAPGATVTLTSAHDAFVIAVPTGIPPEETGDLVEAARRNGYPATQDSDTVITIHATDLPPHPYTGLPNQARATLDHILTHPGPLPAAETGNWVNLITAITHLRFENHNSIAVHVLNDIANTGQPEPATLPTRQVGPFRMTVIPDRPAH